MRRGSYARKTIRHVRRTKASLHLDSSNSSTRTFATSWVFNRRCPFSFLTPLRGRVISAPVSLFFSTGARPSERSTYRRKNPPSLPFNCDFFHLCRLSSSSDDPRMNSCLYTIHLSCQQSRKTSSLFTSEQDTNLYSRLVGISGTYNLEILDFVLRLPASIAFIYQHPSNWYFRYISKLIGLS